MNIVKSGIKTSEFWIHMVAHFAPMLAAYLMNTFCPGAPIATAAVAIVSMVAGQFGASQYSDDRTAVKQAVTSLISQAPALDPVMPIVANIVSTIADTVEHK